MTHFLFVSHDANRAGAQLFLLNLMQYLHQKGYSLSLLLLGKGPLEEDFGKIAEVHYYVYGKPSSYAKLFSNPPSNEQVFVEIRNKKPALAYVNTVACATVVEELKAELNVPVVTHIHELEFSIRMYSDPNARKKLFGLSEKIIACSNAVGENLIENHNVSFEKTVTVHSFVDNEDITERLDTLDRNAIRTKLGIAEDAFTVTGCGNAEWRKGLDLFVQVANFLHQRHPGNAFRFVWIGVKHEGDLFEKTVYDLEKMGLHHTVLLLEPTPQAVEIIGSSDVFLLPSREDPFPLVMLEAALATRPILGFDKTGGCGEFVEDNAGATVPYLDTSQMAEKLVHWQEHPQAARQLGIQARNKVLETYNFENSVQKIEAVLLKLLK